MRQLWFNDPTSFVSSCFRVLLFCAVGCSSSQISGQILENSSVQTLEEKYDSLDPIVLNLLETNKHYEALKEIDKVIALGESFNNTAIKSKAENLLGLAYLQMFAYEKAEAQFEKAIDIILPVPDTFWVCLYHANLVHSYVLSDQFEKYYDFLDKAEYWNELSGCKQTFYLYETKVILLFKEKKFIELINTATDALRNLYVTPNSPLGSRRELVTHRLTITYQIYLAFALIEEHKEIDQAQKLLTELATTNIEDILWFSHRVYELKYQIHRYLCRYYNIFDHNTDSLNHHLQLSHFWANQLYDLLEDKADLNNEYVFQYISKENELEKMELMTENLSVKKKAEFLSLIFFCSLCFIIVLLPIVFFLLRSKNLVSNLNKSLQESQQNLTLKNDNHRKLLRQRDRVIERLDRFNNVLSHDIKQPIRTISSFSSLLNKKLQGKLVDEEKEYFDFIISRSKQLNEHVNNLNRFNSNTKSVFDTYSIIDLNRILERIIAELIPRSRRNINTVQISEKMLIKGRWNLVNQLFSYILESVLGTTSNLASKRIRIYSNRINDKDIISINIANTNPESIALDEQYCHEIMETHQGKFAVKTEYPGSIVIELHFALQYAHAQNSE